jgi:parallel beta-helix repeat protein
MQRKVSVEIMLALLLLGTLSLALDIHSGGADPGTVYIRADGTVDPPTAPIQRNGDLYTLTGNISSEASGIVIERGNMELDGAGYIVHGSKAYESYGIDLYSGNNVTVHDVNIQAFQGGMVCSGCNHTIYRNFLTNNGEGIILSGWYPHDQYNNISGNIIEDNSYDGLIFFDTSDNVVTSNIIENNTWGILFFAWKYGCLNNHVYFNDFRNNTLQVSIFPYEPLPIVNAWSSNYWSNYTGADSDDDGVGDTPHIIDEYNFDPCPLMKPLHFAAKAAQLAKAVLGAKYAWGAKGWKWSDTYNRDWAGGRFLEPSEIKENYRFLLHDENGDHKKFEPGLDCSGLVYWSYNKAYLCTKYSPYNAESKNITRKWNEATKRKEIETVKYLNAIAFEGAPNQWNWNVVKNTNKGTEKKDLKPGDLLFFKGSEGSIKNPRHVAMYVGDYYCNAMKIEGKDYEAGIYDCVEAYNSSTGIVPRRLSVIRMRKGFVGFGRVDEKIPLVVSGKDYLQYKLYSPVNLSVVDPEGFRNTYNMSCEDVEYLQYDVDLDGELDDMIISLQRKMGDYFISVVPKPGANPTDTYSLEVSAENTTKVIADNVPISEIPSQPYIVTSNQTTIIPRLDPHDIGITQFSTSKTVAWRKYPPQLNVTTFNYGQFTETFNVTVYANTTVIATFKNITLTSRNSTTATFTWNTADFARGNYTLTANITQVEGETYTSDNTYTGDTVYLKITGDTNENGNVNVHDLFDLGKAYGLNSTLPNWNPNCDFNEDNIVDDSDLSDLSASYGATDQ